MIAGRAARDYTGPGRYGLIQAAADAGRQDRGRADGGSGDGGSGGAYEGIAIYGGINPNPGYDRGGDLAADAGRDVWRGAWQRMPGGDLAAARAGCMAGSLAADAGRGPGSGPRWMYGGEPGGGRQDRGRA